MASRLKTDENIVFFPTSANRDADGDWTVPVHAWVFEIEGESLFQLFLPNWLQGWRKVARHLGVPGDRLNSQLVRERVKYFILVDNEGGKDVTIKIGQQEARLESTKDNGHSYSDVVFRGAADAGSWLAYSVRLPGKEERVVAGESQLIPATGRSVISDVDDTIKISDVLDKSELIENTFVRPYEAVEGMAEFYKGLREQGRYFHYVSASPWQLYPSLGPFLAAKFPKGSISLRDFRLGDESFVRFFGSSEPYKLNIIEQIVSRYPGHTFTLIGDSGERDPEIYGRIYCRFSDRIEAILIRKVAGSDLSEERLEGAFARVPRALWSLFDTPSELSSSD